MTKRKARKKPAGQPRPENIKPVDPEQFGFAMQLGSAAASYRMPMESPTKQGLNIEMSDGTVQRLAFTDIPMNRAAMAIRDHFAPDMETARAAMMRWMALIRISSSEKMTRWRRRPADDSDNIEIYAAVFDAAATVPLTDTGDFDEELFFRKVEEIAADEDE